MAFRLDIFLLLVALLLSATLISVISSAAESEESSSAITVSDAVTTAPLAFDQTTINDAVTLLSDDHTGNTILPFNARSMIERYTGNNGWMRLIDGN